MSIFRVIIAGGREFNQYEMLKQYCDEMLKHKTNICVVSGAARGADALGEQYAKEKGYPINLYPVTNQDWQKYSGYAGHRRNQKMADNADALIAFWDSRSSGTADMIKRARKAGLPVKIKKYGTIKKESLLF